MPAQRPAVHHVVFCVEPSNVDVTTSLFTELGFALDEIELDDVGLKVLLDWQRGIELITPVDMSKREGQRVRRFLDEHGEGVYTVVVMAGSMEGPLAVAERYGATVAMRQDRGTADYALEEAMLEPIHGIPLTFLVTDLE